MMLHDALPGAARAIPLRWLSCLCMLLSGAVHAQSMPLAHDTDDRHPQTVSLPHAAPAAGAPLAEAVISLARQRELGLRSVVVPEPVAMKPLLLPGRIIADPDASALVVAPESGRLEAPEDGFPPLGGIVKKGTVLALLRPVLSSAEMSDLRAEEADAERDLQSAQVQLDQYRLAGQDVRALTMQSASAYSKLRGERDAAKKRLAELGAVVTHRLALSAPLDGRISYTHVDPGRVVNPGDVIFEIIRPDRLCVRTLNYDIDLLPARHAYLTTASGERFDLELTGMAPALSGRALPLRYRIVDPSSALLVGTPVTVHADGTLPDRTLTLPAVSILDDGNGGHYVWVQQDTENFLARPVRARRTGEDSYMIESGLAPGERVVIAGLALFERPR